MFKVITGTQTPESKKNERPLSRQEKPQLECECDRVSKERETMQGGLPSLWYPEA